jgi:hypothetical protein
VLLLTPPILKCPDFVFPLIPCQFFKIEKLLLSSCSFNALAVRSVRTSIIIRFKYGKQFPRAISSTQPAKLSSGLIISHAAQGSHGRNPQRLRAEPIAVARCIFGGLESRNNYVKLEMHIKRISTYLYKLLDVIHHTCICIQTCQYIIRVG